VLHRVVGFKVCEMGDKRELGFALRLGLLLALALGPVVTDDGKNAALPLRRYPCVVSPSGVPRTQNRM